MKKWMLAFMLMVGVVNVGLADNKKPETKTETETETEDETISLEIAYEMPHTRSLFAGKPEAILCGSCVRVSFEEAVPCADISVQDAGSGACVYKASYTYESEMELDLSGYPQGMYAIRIETGNAAYEGVFSL